ncbi:MAG: glycosyltransferase family 4 protein [Planctomycetes bacterium]|nr:glycosyltransferase family 4 protein [Planctomycetota bacterium]
MRILQVVHLFLPRHRGGVEIYTASLARAQARRGHALRILTTDHLPAEPEWVPRESTWEGIPVTTVVNNKNYTTFDRSYDDPAMARVFETVVDDFRPDVVHLQHLLFLGAGIVDVLARRRIPIVFTLHEYWMLCLRGGQMILPDLRRCDDPPEADCARCVAAGAGMQSPREIAVNRALRRVKATTGIDLWPLARAIRVNTPHVLRRGFAPERAPAPAAPPPWALDAVRARTRRLREIAAKVDLFIAPSPYLRDRFVAWGIPESKIVFSDYGFETERFLHARRAPRAPGPLRAGYVGAVIPSKGVHVLVEAWNRVHGDATCEIWGGTAHRPDYAQACRRASRPESLHFRGEFDPARAPEIFASLDVLVVPSVWFENSPLTIREGFLAGLPVVTSDLGGMRDLVVHEQSGLRFAPGDPAALASALQRLVDDRAFLDKLRAGVPRVKTIDENAAELDRVYELLVARRAGAQASR